MNKDELKTICETLIVTPPCCPDLHAAGRNWLNALGTDKEHEAAEALLKELEEDVGSIDDTIAFFSSPAAAAHFGKENAEKMLDEMKRAKADCAVYCTCPACTLGAKLIEAKDVLLG